MSDGNGRVGGIYKWMLGVAVTAIIFAAGTITTLSWRFVDAKVEAVSMSALRAAEATKEAEESIIRIWQRVADHERAPGHDVMLERARVFDQAIQRNAQAIGELTSVTKTTQELVRDLSHQQNTIADDLKDMAEDMKALKAR